MAMTNGSTNQYCSCCGQQTYGVLPLPKNPNSIQQERRCGSWFYGGGAESVRGNSRNIWDVSSDEYHRQASVVARNSSFDNVSNTTTYPCYQNEVVANTSNQQDTNMMRSYTIASASKGCGKRSSYRNSQKAYSVPNLCSAAETENDERNREVDTARHLAALEREADALQSVRQKIRHTMDDEEDRRKQTLNVITKERKKDFDLAIIKRNEMELIQAVDRRKHAEEEAAILLKRQEIDALEYTRRRLQLEAAKRRREHELSDLEWRRRAAELAAEEAARRRQELEDCLQRPRYSPIASSSQEIDLDIVHNYGNIHSSAPTSVGASADYFAEYNPEGTELCSQCQHLISAAYSKIQPIRKTIAPEPLHLKNITVPKDYVVTEQLPVTQKRKEPVSEYIPATTPIISPRSKIELQAKPSASKVRSTSNLRYRPSKASMSSTDSRQSGKKPNRKKSMCACRKNREHTNRQRRPALTPSQGNKINEIENINNEKRRLAAAEGKPKKKKCGCTIQ